MQLTVNGYDFAFKYNVNRKETGPFENADDTSIRMYS